MEKVLLSRSDWVFLLLCSLFTLCTVAFIPLFMADGIIDWLCNVMQDQILPIEISLSSHIF